MVRGLFSDRIFRDCRADLAVLIAFSRATVREFSHIGEKHQVPFLHLSWTRELVSRTAFQTFGNKRHSGAEWAAETVIMGSKFR